MRTLNAFDVDTDALADTFGRIAAGLRDGDILVEEVETRHRAVVDDPSTFDLRLEFAATQAYEDVVDGIEYDTDGGDK